MSGPPPYSYPYPAPGAWYGPYSGPPPNCTPPPYWNMPQPTAPPPPLYNPLGYGFGTPVMLTPRQTQDVEKRYTKPDVPRLIIHLIQAPAEYVFLTRNARLQFIAFKLPLSMSIKDMFKKLDAFDGKLVVQEAVEMGSGVWMPGRKLLWGCQDVKTVGNIEWKRGGGLSAAANQVIWVVLRTKQEDD